jgi:hypothetical protein
MIFYYFVCNLLVIFFLFVLVDLEAKIRSAQGNQPEILNLMRGFFYWLMVSINFYCVFFSKPFLVLTSICFSNAFNQ